MLNDSHKEAIKDRIKKAFISKLCHYHMAHNYLNKHRKLKKISDICGVFFVVLVAIEATEKVLNLPSELTSIITYFTIFFGIAVATFKHIAEQKQYLLKYEKHKRAATQFRTVEELYQNLYIRNKWDDVEFERISNLCITTVEASDLNDSAYHKEIKDNIQLDSVKGYPSFYLKVPD